MQEDLILEHTYILEDDIGKLHDAFQRIRLNKAANASLKIEAIQELKDIDPAYLGFLALFYRTSPGIQIELKLPYNREQDQETDIIYKIKQYLVYFIIYLGAQPFSVVSANGKLVIPDDHFPRNSLVISRAFSIPLVIDKQNPELYDLLFKDPGQEFTESVMPGWEQEIIWTANTQDLYQKLNHLLRARSKPKDQKNCILNLGRIAFYQALRLTWALTVYLDPERQVDPNKISRHCRAGKLGSADAKDEINALGYFKLIEPIFKEISVKPLIHVFMFNLLLSEEMLPAELDKHNVIDFSKVLHKRWSFCRDLVHGLTELAKNIREHASTHFGIITSRIASLKENEKAGRSFYSEFLSHLPPSREDKPGSILDIQVMDLGEEGILPKLLKNLEDVLNSPGLPESIREAYTEDVRRIKANAVRLQALLAPDAESPLNHQSKRAVAHLGLLIFSKLIEHNNGQLLTITSDQTGKREIVRHPSDTTFSYPLLPAGTFFRFLLPIREGVMYEPHIPHPSDFFIESTPEQVIGLESLLEFSVVKMPHELKEEHQQKKKIVFSLTLPPVEIKTHTDEIKWWKQVIGELEPLNFALKDPRNYVIHFDLENMKPDASQLFRFFGLWELHYPKNPLLISNIDQETIANLVTFNGYYSDQNPDLPYWNPLAPLIVYSYVSGPQDPKNRFYFADALWGKTESDFFLLNHFIQSYHFNSVTWTRRLNGKLSQEEWESREGIEAHPAVFYRKHFLLPFDLLLIQNTGESLFEINARFLLQNDIQPHQKKHEHPI